MNPQVTLEAITPEWAKEVMRNNTESRNRGITNAHVSDLAREMKAGNWKLNGSTIVLNGSRLIDGQHRLLAVIKSGITISSLVVRQIDPEAFDTIDIGRKRSPGDILHIEGYQHVHVLAGGLRIIKNYFDAKLPVVAPYTNQQIRESIRLYPDATESAAWAAANSKCKFLTASYWVAAHYILSQLSQQDAQEFLTSLIMGANLIEGEPVHVLRRKLEDNLGSKTKYPKPYLLAFLIKAWNSQRQGKSCQRLLYKFDSQYQEEYPTAI